ncbi:MAG: single-stranded-DNA-specific exonuclease RecJ [bacterium]|nr:single-stranded-DNA-specific exonuclease RecJ [bacterium]
MARRWEEPVPLEADVVAALMRDLSVSPLIARLLYLRNIRTVDFASTFFNPSPSETHDPYLFPGMETAVARILLARDRHEEVAIYGDSDVDGLTALAVLTRYLRSIGVSVHPYLPTRSDTSYGLHNPGIDELDALGVTLIITVDTGTTAVDAVDYARSAKNIDVIITDHHEPGATLPAAIAVLNPKIAGSTYPFRELSGCAMAFKLTQALAAASGKAWQEIEPLLEFVALGTAADIVPLVGENRTLLSLGMKRLQKATIPGIIALSEVAGIDMQHLAVEDLLMTMSPRINAAARMGNPQRALQLLITNDPEEAGSLAVAVEQDNYRRRALDEQMMREANESVRQSYDPKKDCAIVIVRHNWHLGLIGIMASRIAELYHRPAVILSVENGVGRGSARTVNDFDIHSALSSCSDVMLQFGGHRCAAGLTIPEAAIPGFIERFKSYVAERITITDLQPTIRPDAGLNLELIDHALHRELQRLAPFGPANPRPVFIAKRVEVVGATKVIAQKHLKFRVKQQGKIFNAIALGMADRYHELNGNRSLLDVCFGIDHANGNWDNGLQLRIQDFRPAK